MILAPVAREKKGELELFADMQAQGYVRFRVGGVAYASSYPSSRRPRSTTSTW